MAEFLICRTDGDWFDLHYPQFFEVLHPNSIPYKKLGEYTIEVEGCEVSFFDEMPGIHVVLRKKPLASAIQTQVLQEVLENIERYTGQKGRIDLLTP